MNLTFADVKLYASSLKLLYVEDEASIREQFYNVYTKLFEEVVVANDGEAGLEAYFKLKPDIVISDIRMPIMDGLEMAGHIKQDNPDVQIILTTAHNDGDFLLRAIDAGIDKYVLKPVDKDKLIAALISCCRHINDKKAAERLKLLEIQEQINQKTTGMVSKIIDVVPNAVVLLENEKIIYANKAFCMLAGDDFLEKLNKNSAKIEDIFDVYTDLCDNDNREVCTYKAEVSSKKGRKIYQICKAEVHIAETSGKQTIYVFSDITRLEYQKMKLKQYSEHLEEFFYNKLKQEQSKALAFLSHEEVVAQVGITEKVATDMVSIDGKIAKTFGEQELKVLRKSRLDKLSSADFMKEVGTDISEALEDLQESDHDLEEQILFIGFPAEQNDINGVGVKLAKYASIINQMIDFGDLAIAVQTLSEFILGLSAADVDEKKFKQLNMFLTNIKDDLRNWRLTNFIEQSSENIHYLDASLMSSCLQLQMVFMPKPEVEDDDDDLGLDLF
jgi:YesN/AraC family two-component response regulator